MVLVTGGSSFPKPLAIASAPTTSSLALSAVGGHDDLSGLGSRSSWRINRAWDPSHLYTTMSTVGVPTQPPSNIEGYLDTGATTHLSSSAGNFSRTHLTPSSSLITVSNSAQLPVSHQSFSSIPTSSSPLYLGNVLVVLSLIKNLISIRRYTCTHDNNFNRI